jgi:hypothetical protein
MKSEIKELVVVCALLLFELWNLHQSKRSRRIHLLRFAVQEIKGSREFKNVVLVNIIFTLILFAFIIRLIVKICTH